VISEISSLSQRQTCSACTFTAPVWRQPFEDGCQRNNPYADQNPFADQLVMRRGSMTSALQRGVAVS